LKCRLQLPVEAAVEDELKEGLEALAAGGWAGIQLADFGHSNGKIRNLSPLLQRMGGNIGKPHPIIDASF
jgi:hypothetical protein